MAECRKVINTKVRNFKSFSSYGHAGRNPREKAHSRFASDETKAPWQRYLIEGCPGLRNWSRPQAWLRPAGPGWLLCTAGFTGSLSFPAALEGAQDRGTLSTSSHLPQLGFCISKTGFSSLPPSSQSSVVLLEMWQVFAVSRGLTGCCYEMRTGGHIWGLEATVKVGSPALGVGGVPSERKLVRSKVLEGVPLSVGLGPRRAVGRVWGSQSHPVVAKLGSQQILTEDVLCVRPGDAVASFRDKTPHMWCLHSGSRKQRSAAGRQNTFKRVDCVAA